MVHGESFGGLSVLLLGDEYQMCPVAGWSLTKVNDTEFQTHIRPDDACAHEGLRIWRTISDAVVLHQPMRQRNKNDYDLLCRARKAQINQDDLAILQTLVVNPDTRPEPDIWAHNTRLRNSHLHESN